VANHLKLVETRQTKELAKALNLPLNHIQIALDVIRHLDPKPGLRYSGQSARQVEPDVYITKEGDDFLITLNDEEIPQLRLNGQYRRMLDRDQEPSKEVRNYVKDRYASALQLIKNIEQRKQTILKVCHSIVRRQTGFFDHGIEHLKPMMIKEVAEEIGVHPSTVSRAVANKYAHTPQGVFELRYFFSEAVQGPSGAATPLLLLKRRVKKMIEDEDPHHPLTDEQITTRLQSEGIQVTRRTVAKYREDMRIPSTHQRRVRV
jgi:RNA polymerase sigma-54 factor